MAASSPLRAELRLLEGAGHMVFVNELDRGPPVVIDWTGDPLTEIAD